MVPLDDGVASYACNGTQTIFPITFPFELTTEITVRLRVLATGEEIPWTQGTHYTVVGTDVIAVTAPADTYSLWIVRVTPIDQQDDLNDLSKFPAQGSEDISDKLTRITQELGYKLGKALKLRQSSALSDIEVPDPEDGYFLRWAGNLLVNSKAFGGGSYTIGSFMSDFLQVATLAAMAAKVGIVDAGGRYTAEQVEAALQEIAGAGRTTETLKSLADLIAVIRDIPIGAPIPFGGTTVPAHFLFCDGSSLLRASYSALFGVIGTAFGAIDGTHFNLPDLRGRFLRGQDQGIGRDPDAATRTAMATGGNTGDNAGSVQLDAMQGHVFTFPVFNSAESAGLTAIRVGGNTPTGTFTATLASDGSHGTPRISAETRPLNAYVRFIVRYE